VNRGSVEKTAPDAASLLKESAGYDTIFQYGAWRSWKRVCMGVQVQSPRPQKCYSDLISDQVEMRKTESASQPDVKLFTKWAQMHFLFGGDEGQEKHRETSAGGSRRAKNGHTPKEREEEREKREERDM